MNPCFSHNPQCFQFFQGADVEHGMLPLSPSAVPHATDVLAYHVAVLRDKVQQLEPLVGMIISPPNPHHHSRYEAAAMVAHSACSVLQPALQEITAAASMVAHRLSFNRATASNEQMFAAAHGAETLPFGHEPVALFSGGDASTSTAAHLAGSFSVSGASASGLTGTGDLGLAGDDADGVVELDASYLLARYTHYCQVCGKGFKRDANLRMHMRAHGDEYKTSAALSNPRSSSAAAAAAVERRSYSCPAEGCRWNRRYPRFQPLKSVVCAKNHYRRSHCPKVYACRRCDGKQFAVLSDLRTHEKHYGELRWRCSCDTFFSRKDKLMGHVALFATGHAPVPATVAPRLRS